MIAVDTNLLVYSHREDSEWFQPAEACVRALAEGAEPWAIPWPCLHEFLSVVTHPRIFETPTPLGVALEQVEAWSGSPSLVVLGEGPGYWPKLADLLRVSRGVGPLVHDARVAALCLAHGVSVLWSADRDFGRFPALTVRNPLVNL